MTRPLPPIAILAGGLATRMRPITDTIPKAMIEVAGRPFIAHQLELLARNDITDVVLLLGYRGEQIEQFVGDGSQYGLRVSYSYDGPTQLGTGGALRKALPLLGPRFFVLYGDSYLDISYRSVADAFRPEAVEGVMSVFRNDNALDRSNIVLRDGMVLHYSKTASYPDMNWIDYGVSVLQASDFQSWPDETAFRLEQVFEAIIHRGKLAGYEVDKRFYEIGSLQGLAETEAYLLTRTAP